MWVEAQLSILNELFIVCMILTCVYSFYFILILIKFQIIIFNFYKMMISF